MDRGIDLLERRVVRLLKWMQRERSDVLDMVSGSSDADEWCRDQAEIIGEHIKTVRDLYEAAKR